MGKHASTEIDTKPLTHEPQGKHRADGTATGPNWDDAAMERLYQAVIHEEGFAAYLAEED